MPRNGSGSMEITGADFTNGTLADADEVMAKFNDVETALTASIAKDGQTVPTAALPMGTYNHTNVGVATARTHYARASQVADGSLTYGGVGGGTADAITIAPSPAITAYAIGQQFQFKVGAAANTGAVTLNVNSVGAGAVTWPDGTALVAGDLPANAMVLVEVQATTPVFHLMSSTRAPLVSAGPWIAGRVSSTGAAQALTALQASNILLNTASFGLKEINGWTYANNVADATNDIDIAAGAGADSTGVYWIKTAALTKRLDAAWTVGTNQGGLDTGSIGNSDYYIWAIARSDTGVTDILFSLSSTAPTMPTSYDYKRLIGWFKRAGATIVAFTTYETAGGGLQFLWNAPRLDVDLTSTLTTSRRTDALSVPLNRATDALIRTVLFDNASSFTALICSPDETDAAPSTSASPGANVFGQATIIWAGEMRIRTSSTGTIAARSLLATVDNYRVFTYGFVDSRR